MTIDDTQQPNNLNAWPYPGDRTTRPLHHKRHDYVDVQHYVNAIQRSIAAGEIDGYLSHERLYDLFPELTHYADRMQIISLLQEAGTLSLTGNYEIQHPPNDDN